MSKRGPYKKKLVIERLLEKRHITKFGCWEWLGCKDAFGYGHIRISKYGEGSRAAQVHRVIMGEPPACVLHKCHNPTCFNPAHLYIGDKRDNLLDAYDTGNRRSGENHNFAKLSDEQAKEIKIKYKTGRFLQKQLAEDYGISQPHVSYIVNGKRRDSEGVRI